MFYILTKGKHPYKANTPDEVERKIRKGEQDLLAVGVPVTVDMLEKMLPVDPKERLSAASLLG